MKHFVPLDNFTKVAYISVSSTLVYLRIAWESSKNVYQEQDHLPVKMA